MKVPTVPAFEDMPEDPSIRHLLIRHKHALAGLSWQNAPKTDEGIIAEAKDPEGERYRYEAGKGVWDSYHATLHKTGVPTHAHADPEASEV